MTTPVIQYNEIPERGRNDVSIGSEVRALIERMCERRPQLAEVFGEGGSQRAVDYVRDLFLYLPAAIFTKRRSRLLGQLAQAAEHALSGWGLERSSLDASLAALSQHPVLLTSDHHSLLTFPLLVHGNALFCMPDLLEDRAIFRFSLAGAMVPLDNVTVRRSGLHVTDCKNGKTRSIALFPKRTASQAVYATPQFGMFEIEAALKVARELLRSGAIDERIRASLDLVLNNVCASRRVLELPDFAAQASSVNATLWNLLHGLSRTRALNICLEHVVSPALVAELRERPDELLATALLDPAWRTDLRERFAGIQGCWARGEDTRGTFLFWGMRAGRTVPLHEECGELVGDGVRVRLEAHALADALERRELAPGTFVSIWLVALHAGFSCVGGFNQATYLPLMRSCWSELLRDRREAEEAVAVDSVPAPFLVGPAIAFVRHAEGLSPASGIDLLAHGGMSRSLLERVASHSLKELWLPALPGIARIVLGADTETPSVERLVQLTSVNDLILSEPDEVT
jgi:hypothetical protein